MEKWKELEMGKTIEKEQTKNNNNKEEEEYLFIYLFPKGGFRISTKRAI